CTLLAASCEGQDITTIEGVTEHGSLAAIQKAYGDWGGAQCGYCTPGFIMTVKSLLAENPDPSEADIRNALSSNLCRCTGYNQMYSAIRAAIQAERQGMATGEKCALNSPSSASPRPWSMPPGRRPARASTPTTSACRACWWERFCIP